MKNFKTIWTRPIVAGRALLVAALLCVTSSGVLAQGNFVLSDPGTVETLPDQRWEEKLRSLDQFHVDPFMPLFHGQRVSANLLNNAVALEYNGQIGRFRTLTSSRINISPDETFLIERLGVKLETLRVAFEANPNSSATKQAQLDVQNEYRQVIGPLGPFGIGIVNTGLSSQKDGLAFEYRKKILFALGRNSSRKAGNNLPNTTLGFINNLIKEANAIAGTFNSHPAVVAYNLRRGVRQQKLFLPLLPLHEVPSSRPTGPTIDLNNRMRVLAFLLRTVPRAQILRIVQNRNFPRFALERFNGDRLEALVFLLRFNSIEPPRPASRVDVRSRITPDNLRSRIRR